MKEEAFLVTNKDEKRFQIINKTIDKIITQREASEYLEISERQIRRLVRQVKENGLKGIIHKSKNKPSAKKTQDTIKQRIIELKTSKYIDFKPTFFTEKLKNNEGIVTSTETVRKILIEAGLHQNKKAKQQHRQYRERRSCFGELVQLDGSYHNWFGEEKSWLIGYIDDATNITYLKFTDSESTIAVMKTTEGYINKYGCPISLYVDKDSIYKTTRGQNIEEQLKDDLPMTQFTRAMNELGIKVICANSPQAKGRIERSFKTHQDRLVKELKLKGITTIEEANKFLADEYTPYHNQKFSIEAKSKENMHLKLPKNANLDAILSVQNKRSIYNDFTVRYNGRVFQILKEQKINVLTRNKVIVEERLDESIHIKYKKTYLNFKEITEKTKKKVRKDKDFNVLTRKEISQIKDITKFMKTMVTDKNSPDRTFSLCEK